MKFSTNRFNPILVLLFAIGLSGIVSCSKSDIENASTVSLNGLFLAEESTDYFKLINIKSSDNEIEILSKLTYDGFSAFHGYEKGKEVHLKYSEDSGGRSGSASVGDIISAGSTTGVDNVNEVDTKITILSNERIKYTVQFLKHKQMQKEVVGFLRKVTSSAEVLQFLSKQVKIQKQILSNNYPVNWGIDDLKKMQQNQYCLKHFFNSCEDLIKIGFIPFETKEAPPSGGPKTPDTNYPSVGIPVEEKRVHIDNSGKNPNPYIEIPSKKSGKLIVKAANVQCMDPTECPPYIGLLIGSTGKQVFQCSATYIGNGYFSSNRHCVPENLVTGDRHEKSCRDSIWVKMPKTENYEAQTFECDEIALLTKLNENTDPDESRDVVIFKVKGNVEREEAKINWTAKPKISSSVNSWVVDPVPSKPGINGLIVKKTCSIYDPRGLDVILRVFDEHYAVSYLNQCEPGFIQGNSGSTIFDEMGFGIAIVSTGLSTQRKTSKYETIMASNYSCLMATIDQNGEVIDQQRNGCMWISSSDLVHRIESAKKLSSKEATRAVQIIIQAFNDYLTEIRTNNNVVFENYNTKIEQAYQQPRFQKFFMGSKSLDWKEAAGDSAASSLSYTDYFGNTHNLSTQGFPFDFSYNSILLPMCIKNPQLWMKEYRKDNKWNPISKIKYASVKIRVPITSKFSLRPRPTMVELHAGNLDSFSIISNASEEDLGSVMDLTVSEYYTSEGKAKLPKIKVEYSNHSLPDNVSKRIKAHFDNMELCK